MADIIPFHQPSPADAESGADRGRKRSGGKRKVNWYQKGQRDAQKYWRNMVAGEGSDGEPEFISGYLAVLADESAAEIDSGSKDDVGYPSMGYISGFAEVTQERIEDLMERAALHNGIVNAVRVAGKHPQKAEAGHAS